MNNTKQKSRHFRDRIFALANNDNMDTNCTPPKQYRSLEVKRFSTSCTRILFLPGLTDSSVELGLFIFKALLLCPLNSIRVKGGLIVCEMGIRVQDVI